MSNRQIYLADLRRVLMSVVEWLLSVECVGSVCKDLAVELFNLESWNFQEYQFHALLTTCKLPKSLLYGEQGSGSRATGCQQVW